MVPDPAIAPTIDGHPMPMHDTAMALGYDKHPTDYEPGVGGPLVAVAAIVIGLIVAFTFA